MQGAEPCFCFYGIWGEIHYCERHGGGVGERAPRVPENCFEPHPIILPEVGGSVPTGEKK
jgi:hypothetical protein